MLFQPLAPHKADHKADGAEHPVQEHAHPDAEQLAVEAEHHQVAETHPEHPHGHDADRHGKRGVACRTEDVGQGKAGGPEEDREDVEPLHHLQGHGLRFRREMEEGQRQLVRKEERRQVHDPGTRIGQQKQAAGVPDSLLFLACAQALAHHGEHGKAHGAGRDVEERGGGVGHGVGGNGGGTQGAGQAGHRQLADLEHAVLNAGRDAHSQDALDEPAVGPESGKTLYAEHTAGLLQQEKHRDAGNGAGDQAGEGRAQHAHPEAKDEDGVAADVDNVHHQAGHHAHLAVALRPEQCRTGVVQANERVAQS